MGRSIDARLARLEQWQARREKRRLYGAIAAEFGLTVDELLDEVEQFLSKPLADQLAEVDRLQAESQAKGIPWDEADEIKATLSREYRP